MSIPFDTTVTVAATDSGDTHPRPATIPDFYTTPTGDWELRRNHLFHEVDRVLDFVGIVCCGFLNGEKTEQ